MKNPFKFGTVVERPYFTDRKNEIEKVKSVVSSENHLVLISPRRFGKTSLVLNALSELKRSYIYLDLQLISSVTDFASELLKRIYSVYKIAKLRELVKSFRVVPTLNLNAITNEISVSFQPTQNELPILEDVFNLLESLAKSKKIIVVFDEFQEILKIEKNFDSFLRGNLQHHKNINYVFLGSREAMMSEIFTNKKSPFYHFGYLMNLDKIPYNEFAEYLNSRFIEITENHTSISKEILEISNCHPYYTQQLAYVVWENLTKKIPANDPVSDAIEELIISYDYNFEKIWDNFNQTDKKILIFLAENGNTLLSRDSLLKIGLASSTVHSSLKRLSEVGYLLKSDGEYLIEDPFFKRWIIFRRNMV